MKPKTIISRFLIIFATVLIVINVFGIFSNLRNDEIYTEKATFFNNDINLTEDEVIELLKIKNNNPKEFAIKANEVVNNGIAHYWLDEGISKYNLRVPLIENYILFASSYLYPSGFKKYEFCDYEKALERGVGLCSQHSIILSQFLSRSDIENKIIGLSGHVVITAQVEQETDTWWVFDPDYGVTIEHNIEAIENDPKLIRIFYSNEGYSQDNIAMLEGIFGKDGNDISDNVKSYSTSKKYYFEKASYVGIWLIPLILLGMAIRLNKSETKKGD